MKARAIVGEVLNLDPSLGVPEPYIPWFYAEPSQVGFQQLWIIMFAYTVYNIF